MEEKDGDVGACVRVFLSFSGCSVKLPPEGTALLFTTTIPKNGTR